MTKTLLRFCTSLIVVASSALVSAQLLPSVPPKQFGGSTVAELKLDGNEPLQREIAYWDGWAIASCLLSVM